MATAMPPLAVPSSLVRTMPVTPADWVKRRACWRPFWPVVASMTSSTSWGAPGMSLAAVRRILSSSSMRPVLVCRRPAVSTIEIVDVAGLGGGDGVVEDGGRVAALAGLDHLDAGAGGPDFKLLDGGGAEGVGGAEQDGAVLGADTRRRACRLEVVLPVPLTPTRKVTLGGVGGRWGWRRCGASKDGAQLLL